MAKGLNKVMLIGRLGQDPDVRSTASGTQVVNLSIATDESYKDKQSGQIVDAVEWHRVVLFGKTAEVAATYLRKGGQVYIEGKNRTRKWQDQAGVDRYTTEVVGQQMQMLGSPSNATGGAQGGTGTNGQGGGRPPQGGTNGPPPDNFDDFDDDIPF